MNQPTDFVVSSLRNRLIVEEGLRLKPYKDTVGKLTIGVGRNLDDCGITQQEAEAMLTTDISNVFVALDRALPWWRSLNDARQVVLADMCFNLGITKLLGFKNTLRDVKEGNYISASQGMLNSLWAKQVGNRAVQLAQMMAKGS